MVPPERIERSNFGLEIQIPESTGGGNYWWEGAESNYSRLKNCFTDSLLEPLALPSLIFRIGNIEPLSYLVKPLVC